MMVLKISAKSTWHDEYASSAETLCSSNSLRVKLMIYWGVDADTHLITLYAQDRDSHLVT